MDAFDIFGDEPATASAAAASASTTTVLPRASTHPHFTSCAGIWPQQLPSEGDSDALGKAFASGRSEAVVAGLRKSRIQYGKACAKSLAAACAAFCSNGPGSSELEESARAVKNLCMAAIDEANWDVPAWQEANLLALGFLLSSMLAAEVRGHEQDEHTEAVGAAAIALFNLAVSAACSLLSPPPWAPWVGSLLHRSERAVRAAWRPVGPPAGLGCASQEAGAEDARWRICSDLPVHRLPTISAARRVPEIDAESLPCAKFFSEYLQPGKPLLIRKHLAAEQWRALDYFADLRALHASAGDRLVPVNLGSPLVGYGGVVHWPLRRLIEEHLLPSNATHALPPSVPADEEAQCTVAYCSQHHLLHQHAELQELLAVPPYTVGRELSPANLWIGTRGTVTSLHSDPSDNLLCQVAGYKYFRLYALDQTPKLYATVQRGNNTNSFGTSPVRVEAPIPPEHAMFEGAEFVEGVLAPGDMLFLPKSVWHYVRSLTTSVSVNFWF